MSSSLASYLAQDKDANAAMALAKQFVFDADGIRLVNQLSLRDWREWWPMAKPPFEQTWLEWSPDDYLTTPIVSGDKRFDRVGCLFAPGKVSVDELGPDKEVIDTLTWQAMTAKLYYGYKRQAHEIPYTMVFDQTDAYLEEQLKHGREFIRKAWGQPYFDKYGTPPILVMMPATWARAKSDLAAASAVSAFIGCPRVAMAALALINTEKTRQAYPQSYIQGRTLGVKGNSIPQHTPATVVLRPDAIRYVIENAEREPSGIRKKEHDVRGHWRQLPGRKVWVKSHKRGDAALGVVESSYRVSRAPPTLQTSADDERS